MIRRALAILAVLAAAPAGAQQPGEIEISPLTPEALGEVPEEEQPQASAAPGGVLRALDKVSGVTEDLTLSAGESARFGRVEVTLGECRYPTENPEGDAYAYLVIRVDGTEGAVFAGWMVASSPALNAMDHPRYDVWVLRCITS